MGEIKILTFFTDPYKDELLYSSIARYHFYSGNINCRDTLEELFKSRSVNASVGIGSRFSILAEQMGRNYSVEYLLANHTIYPYYAPFLSFQRQQKVLSGIKGIGSGRYWRPRMLSGGICRKVGFYYCSLCATDDIEKYGEPYVHREHQLQGIEYCAHHEIKLKKYAIDPRTGSRSVYIRFDEKILDLTVSIKGEHDEFSKIQLKLAKMAYQLLHIPHNKLSRELIILKYNALFRRQNLITLKNKVRNKELYRTFSLKFPKGFLEKYESSLDETDDDNWLYKITNNTKRNDHPFRHLLMIYYFDLDIESFLTIEPDQGPFGLGPWPCLNKAATHLKQELVTKLVIKRDSRSLSPVGIFSCSCGFVYARKGPDKTAEDKYRLSYVKEYGDIWRAKVQELHRNGLSINKIAAQLKVCPDTIWKQLRFNKKSKHVDMISVNKEAVIEKYRIDLLKGMKQFPNYSRTDLSRRFRNAYRFLSVNDKEWFNANMPDKQKKVQVNMVDWDMRDQEYYEKITDFYEELLKLEKPVRVTPSAIGRALNIRQNIDMKDKLAKLPRTNQLLNEITESVKEFQIRRCLKIIDKFLENGEPVILWKVQEKGGLNSHHFNKIKPVLEGYLKGEMNNS